MHTASGSIASWQIDFTADGGSDPSVLCHRAGRLVDPGGHGGRIQCRRLGQRQEIERERAVRQSLRGDSRSDESAGVHERPGRADGPELRQETAPEWSGCVKDWSCTDRSDGARDPGCQRQYTASGRGTPNTECRVWHPWSSGKHHESRWGASNHFRRDEPAAVERGPEANDTPDAHSECIEWDGDGTGLPSAKHCPWEPSANAKRHAWQLGRIRKT